MNDYNYPKSFDHEELKLHIEFRALNNKYVAHKIYKNGHLVPIKSLNLIESEFYSDCYLMYLEFLKLKGIDYYKGGEN